MDNVLFKTTGTIRFFRDEYGLFVIPKHLEYLKFTKSGRYDKRRGKDYYADFKKWLDYERLQSMKSS